MKFKLFFLIFFLTSCTSSNINNKKNTFIPYTSKGFALIYNDDDYNNKLISKKLDNQKLLIAHNKLKKNTIITLTNVNNKKTITLKIAKNIDYPNFYKILITQKVADELKIDKNLPFVDLQQKVQNVSFVAKKGITFPEEKYVSGKAPVTKVKISSISSKDKKSPNTKKNFSIILGDFYSEVSANELKSFLIKDYVRDANLTVKKLQKNNYRLLAGPYSSISALKNDYFKLQKYGFEDLDIEQYD